MTSEDGRAGRLVGDTLVAWGPLGLLALLVRSRRVGHWEAALSRRVNRLPDALERPLWVVMQSGALASPFVAAGVAVAAGRPRLGERLAVTGLSAYLLAKVVKRSVGRGRPADLLAEITVRGKPQTGNGFVSGHAAVSTGLALVAADALDGPARAMTLAIPPVVAVARIYVGAHLPLDVLGGAALGWALYRSLPGQLASRWGLSP